MKSVILSATLLALLLPVGAPAMAAPSALSFVAPDDTATVTVEKRRKRRVPGGSGCDDPGDIIEHPECAG